MKIKDPTTRAIVSMIASVVAFFLFLGIFGVYQKGMTFREQVAAAKPAVAVSFLIAVITFPTVAFMTKLDADKIEKIQTDMTIDVEEAEIRELVKTITLTASEIKEPDFYTQHMITILDVVSATIIRIKATITVEDMNDMQILKILLKDSADSFVIHKDRLKALKYKPDLKDKIEEDRKKMPVLLMGFVELLDKVSDSSDENLALNQAILKMRAWGYVDQLKELELKKKQKE